MSIDDNLWYDIASALLRSAERSERPDEIVKAIVRILSPFMQGANYQKYFRLFEQEGIHITPVHFYVPIPDTRILGEELFQIDSNLPGIAMNDESQLDLLKKQFPRFQEEYNRIPHDATGDPSAYHFNNEFFGGIDACVLYCMVRHFKPNLIVEVGSGFSTLLSAQAGLKNGNTKIISIEPYPSDVLRNGFPGLTQLMTNKVQDTDLQLFERLGPSDILFIDSSHIVQIGSDVNFLFLEVLPRLNPGVIVHIHDIYLPAAGRRDWVMDGIRFWNEQYLLQAFLILNKDFEVLFANHYLAGKYSDDLKTMFPQSPYWDGGSFWIRRTT